MNKQTVKPAEVEMRKIYRSYLRSEESEFEDDFVSRLEVLDVIDRRVEQLMAHPEFRKKNVDIDLYDLRRMVMELPAYELRRYGSWRYTGAMWKCDHCGYEVMLYNNTPYCPMCGYYMTEAKI